MDELLSALVESRNLALTQGDYDSAMKEHENLLRNVSKMSKSASAEELRRLEALRDQVKVELNMMQDLAAEISYLSGLGQDPYNAERVGRGSEQESGDPDVWPPPTPAAAPSQRQLGAEGSVPPWARQKDSDRRQSAGGPSQGPLARRQPEPVARRLSEEPKNVARMRNERDSVPVNRKRFIYIYLKSPLDLLT
jgi:hypothetical protein